MEASVNVKNILAERAKVYESAVIKSLRAQLIKSGSQYSKEGLQGSDDKVLNICLGLEGADFSGIRIDSRKKVTFINEGGRLKEVSKNRERIIDNLKHYVEDEKELEKRIGGVYLEQLGQEYIERVAKILFNDGTFVRESRSSKGQDPNYDWYLSFKLQNVEDMSKEEKKALKNKIKFEHKSHLDNFHITDNYLDIRYVDDYIKEDELYTMSISDMAMIALLLKKFDNNYPIFFSILDEKYLLSSQVFEEKTGKLYIKDIKENIDIDRETEKLYQESYNFDNEEADIYLEDLKNNSKVYEGFKKDVIRSAIADNKFKVSLWYGKR